MGEPFLEPLGEGPNPLLSWDPDLEDVMIGEEHDADFAQRASALRFDEGGGPSDDGTSTPGEDL